MENTESSVYEAPSRKLFYIHLVIYVIAMAVLWGYYYSVNKSLHGGAYPWEAWFTGSWFIFFLGHFCNTFFDSNRGNSDKGYLKFKYEAEH